MTGGGQEGGELGKGNEAGGLKSGGLIVREDTAWGEDTEKQPEKESSGVTLELAPGWIFISVLMWDCILFVQGGGHILFSVQ